MQLLVDARTARTGGGTTLLRIVEDQLRGQMTGYELDIRRPASFEHPLRPLASPRTRATAILGLSESCNVGWPRQPYVMLARNWKCWGTDRSARALARKAVAHRNGRRASVVVSATQTFADAIRSQLPGVDVRTVRFGVSGVFSPRGERASGQYILSVGDLYRHKRFDLVIDAFAKAGLEDDFELRIAGSCVDTNLFKELQERIVSRGLAGRVVFMNSVEPADLAALYRGAAATLLASDLESFGHPYIEAMASGCPIVGRISTVADEVTAGSATLVGPDPEEFAQALKTIVSADRSAITAKGLEQSRAFHWGSWTTSLADIFHEFG